MKKIFLVVLFMFIIATPVFVIAKNVSKPKKIPSNINVVNFQGTVEAINGNNYTVKISGTKGGNKKSFLVAGKNILVQAVDKAKNKKNPKTKNNHGLNKKIIKVGDEVVISGILNSDGTISKAHVMKKPKFGRFNSPK